MTAAGRKAPGRAQNLTYQVAFFDGDSCQKCFYVTFDERNKACAVFGANMTDKRKGKIAYGENDKCNARKRFCEP